MSALRTAAAASAALLVSPLATAQQTPLWQTNGAVPSSEHGFSLAVIGDVNGNGTDDVLIGEIGNSRGTGPGAISRAGSVMVRDGNGTCITIFYGLATGEELGSAVAEVPDRNLDGRPEMLMGARGHASNAGRVYYYLGGTSGGGIPGCSGVSWVAPQAMITGANAGDNFGSEIVYAEDVDLTPGPQAGVAIAAPSGQPAGSSFDLGYVTVYDMAALHTGAVSPRYTIAGTQGGAQFGASIAVVHDLDGDGIRDLAIGSPAEDVGTDANKGRFRTFSGATGALLDVFDPPSSSLPGIAYGFALAAVSDLNGDGFDELAVSAPYDGYYDGGVYTGAIGRVRVLSGKWLSDPAKTADDVLLEFWGNDLYAPQGLQGGNDAFGASLANLGDLDGDGYDDLAVGASGAPTYHPDSVSPGNWPTGFERFDTGQVRLLSLGAGELLTEMFDAASAAGDNYGAAVAGGGDLNGDGLDDFVVGAFRESGTGGASSGTVRAYSGDLTFGRVYATGNANSTGVTTKLGAFGSMATGANDLEFRVWNGPPSQTGLVLYGLEQTTGTPYGSGILFVGPGSQQIYRLDTVTLSPSGTLSYQPDLTMPPVATGLILPHSRWNFQFWHRDGGTENLSDAVTIGFY